MVRLGAVGYGWVRCGEVRYGLTSVQLLPAKAEAALFGMVPYGVARCGWVRFGLTSINSSLHQQRQLYSVW